MSKIAPPLGKARFACSGRARGKGDRHFRRPAAATFHEQLEGDLVADGIEGRGLSPRAAVKSKKAGHGVTQASKRAGQNCCGSAAQPTYNGPVGGDRSGPAVPRADDEVAVALIQ